MVAGNRWSSARLRGGIAVALGCVALLFCWWTSGRYATAQESKPAPTLSPTAQQISPSRIGADLGYLASDELEGRGLGTEGLNKAANYIASEFAKAKLKTDLYEGKPFHTFQLLASVDRGPAEKNTLTFVGPPEKAGGEPRRITLKLEQDFQTLALGGSGKLDAPVVFAGYGITAKNEDYDDFAGLNVEGKIVVVIRREPQQNNPHSKFNGTQASQYAPFTRKVSNATEHGAAAIVMVNDDFSVRQARDNELKNWRETADKLADARAEFKKKENPSAEEEAKHRADIVKLAEQLKVSADRLTGDFDSILGFQEAGAATNPKTIPVLFAKRAAVDPVVKAALGKDLATLEKEIDEGPKPASAAMADWKVQGEADVQFKQADVKNVLGVIEGEGPLADETIVIGAHYDHVGKGGPGSGSLVSGPWVPEVHNGADDNGSGTVGLLEVARYFGSQAKKPKRRLVFIAFTGEERGLLGSARYVREPRFPLEKTIAMVNMDMIGRLTENKLIVYGTGTATEFNPLIDKLNEQYAFALTKHPEGLGPSDHASFYPKKIPVFHFFTGTHPDYHRPSDDADKINKDGMQRIVGMVCDVVTAIDQADKKPEYLEVKGRAQVARGGDRPYFGAIPDFAQAGDGCALTGVSKNSPAERGGIKPGDVIVKLGESKITSLEDFDSALRKFKAGDKVAVVLRRGKEMVTVEVRLDPPR